MDARHSMRTIYRLSLLTLLSSLVVASPYKSRRTFPGGHHSEGVSSGPHHNVESNNDAVRPDPVPVQLHERQWGPPPDSAYNVGSNNNAVNPEAVRPKPFAGQQQPDSDAFIICDGQLPSRNVQGFTGQRLPAAVYEFANTSLELCSDAYGIQGSNAGCECVGPFPLNVTCNGQTSNPAITQDVINFCQGYKQTPPACRCANQAEAHNIALGRESHGGGPPIKNITIKPPPNRPDNPFNPFNVSAEPGDEQVYTPPRNWGPIVAEPDGVGPGAGGH